MPKYCLGIKTQNHINVVEVLMWPLFWKRLRQQYDSGPELITELGSV